MPAGPFPESLTTPPSRLGSPSVRGPVAGLVKILLIQDNPNDTQRMREVLAEAETSSFELTHIRQASEAKKRFADEMVHVVLLDISRPEGQGMEALRALNSQSFGVPILVLADLPSEAAAQKAVQQGIAQDYLVKGHLTSKLLAQAIFYALERGKMLAQLKKSRQAANPSESHDALTNLPNRPMFHDRLREALGQAREQARMVAVLLLNLEGFRLVHNTLGPNVGDPLLRMIAKRLTEGITGCIRGSDTVARLNGDEFAIVLDGISQMRDAAKVAENVLEAFTRPFVLNGLEFFITTTIGISLYPFDGADPDTLVTNADIALRRSREQGSNSYQFYLPAVNDKFLSRMELQDSLRIALAREEFRVYYMPQVDVQTGRIVSMEALARWKHPTLGLVSPVDFIPLAEETGLILPIGERMLRIACAQARAWRDAGLPPIRVSVNFSARQLQHQNPVALVSRVLKETGLEPGSLELEITESSIMKDASSALSMLRAFKDAGIHLAIDDFGTGYSSLSYLKLFPIDALKIDRSFVREITSRPDDAAIVTAVIAMAASLKLKVIAEGVEAEDQLQWLHSMKCDQAQGYLISRPVPAEAATQLLTEDRRF